MSLYDENLEKLLISYNELDDNMKKYIDEDEWSNHTDLIKKIIKSNKLLRQHKHELKLFDNLRNRVIHYPSRLVAENIVESPDYTVNQYDHDIKKYIEIKSL